MNTRGWKKCTIEEKVGITTFRVIFYNIYGDMPAKYPIKYKMTIDTKFLNDYSLSIVTIEMDLGYNDPSKFSAVFKRAYSILHKDYKEFLRLWNIIGKSIMFRERMIISISLHYSSVGCS